MLIGITGYSTFTNSAIEAGKGQTRKYLQQYLSQFSNGLYDIREVSLADKLKEVVCDVFDIPLENAYTHAGKTSTYTSLNNHTLREALQHIGTEGFRYINPRVWSNYVARQDTVTSILINEDTRFIDEQKVIQEKGGYTIGVFRSSDPDIIDVLETPQIRRKDNLESREVIARYIEKHKDSEQHDSEQELADVFRSVDYLVLNCYDLGSLESQVRSVAITILQAHAAQQLKNNLPAL